MSSCHFITSCSRDIQQAQVSHRFCKSSVTRPAPGNLFPPANETGLFPSADMVCTACPFFRVGRLFLLNILLPQFPT